MTQGEDDLTVQCRAKVGQTLQGKWTLDKLIGVGGMAAVYLGKHRNGATAAIKLLHAEYAAHPETRSRFLREAYIANKVDHPGSVRAGIAYGCQINDSVIQEAHDVHMHKIFTEKGVRACQP